MNYNAMYYEDISCFQGADNCHLMDDSFNGAGEFVTSGGGGGLGGGF